MSDHINLEEIKLAAFLAEVEPALSKPGIEDDPILDSLYATLTKTAGGVKTLDQLAEVIKFLSQQGKKDLEIANKIKQRWGWTRERFTDSELLDFVSKKQKELKAADNAAKTTKATTQTGSAASKETALVPTDKTKPTQGVIVDKTDDAVNTAVTKTETPKPSPKPGDAKKNDETMWETFKKFVGKNKKSLGIGSGIGLGIGGGYHLLTKNDKAE